MKRTTDEDVVIRTWKMEVSGHRKIGRLKLRWYDVVRKDMKKNGVQKEEAQEHGEGKLDTSIPNRGKAKEVYIKKCRLFLQYTNAIRL